MYLSRRNRSVLAVAVAVGLPPLLSTPVRAQQISKDQVIFFSGIDGSGTTGFNSDANYQASTGLYSTPDSFGNYSNNAIVSAGTAGGAPKTGYAYVITGGPPNSAQTTSPVGSDSGMMRSPTTTSAVFGGDSLTIIPYNAQANLYNATSTSTGINNQADQTAALFLKGSAGASFTVGTPNASQGGLVLANGGALINFNNNAEAIAGNIYLVPAGKTMDGVTTTVSGGIIDPRESNTTSASTIQVNSTIAGAGQLHILETQNTTGIYTSAVILNANNSAGFTGGVNLDNTCPYGTYFLNLTNGIVGTSSYPVLIVDNPAALGTGTLTITGAQAGPTISNGTGSAETLTTNNPVLLNGSLQFGYNSSAFSGLSNFSYTVNPLNIGTGLVTLGQNATIQTNASTLTIGGNIVSGSSGSYTLSATGAGTLNLSSAAISVPITIAVGTVNATSASSVFSQTVTVNAAGVLELFSPSTTFQGGITANSLGTIALSVGGSGFANSDLATFLASSVPTFNSGSMLGLDTTAGNFNVSSGLSGNFGINKIGANTLTLAGSNTFGGPITVTAGNLILGPNTSISSSNGINVSTGILDLNGNNANVTSLIGSGVLTNNNSTPVLITVTSSSSGTFNGNITQNVSGGAISLTVAGSSTSVLSLGGTNSFTGPLTLQSGILNFNSAGSFPSASTVTFSGGTFQFSSNYKADPSARFSTAAGQSFSLDTNGQNINLSTGLNSSSGSLNKLGAGTLYLSGVGNVSSTTVTAGSLELAGSNSSYGSVTVNSGATLALAVGGTNANAVPQLNNTDIGNILGSASLNSGSTLAVDTTGGNFNLSYGFSDPGGFTKLGGNTLVLTGADTIQGSVTISAGTLVLNPNVSLASSALNFSSGVLDLGGLSLTLPVLNAPSGTSIINSGAAATLTVGGSTNSSFAGNISSGITLNVSGGLLTLSGNDSYTGNTNLLTGGTLNLGSGTAVSSSTLSSINFLGGTLSFGVVTDPSAHFSNASGQSFNLNTNANAITLASAVTTVDGTGSLTKLGTGTLTLNAPWNITGTINVSSGNLSLGVANALNASSSLLVVGGSKLNLANNALTVAGVSLQGGSTITDSGTSGVLISTTTFDAQSGNFAVLLGGSAGLTKSTAGTVYLSNSSGVSIANSYSGITNINAGILNFNYSGALSPNTTVQFNGGTFQFSSTYKADPSAQFSTTGGQTFALDTNGQNINMSTGLTSSGGSLNKLGSGTLYLSGVSSTLGSTTVTAGTLELAASNSSYGSISVASGATLALAVGGTNANSIPQLNNADLSNVLGSTSLNTGAILAVDTSGGNFNMSASFNDPGAFTKLGANTLVLTGTDSITGPILVSGGSLVYGANVTLGSSNVTINSSGVLDLYGVSTTIPVLNGSAGTGIISSTGPATLTVGSSTASSFAGNISTGVALNVSGGALTLSGNDAFTGPTNLLPGGTLILGSVNAASGSSTISFLGGTLQFGLNSTATSTDPSAHFSPASGQAFNINTGTFTANFSTGINTVDQTGSLTKLGTGTLNLLAASNISGTTNVSAGTLGLGIANALSSQSSILVSGGTLNLYAYPESVGAVTLVSGTISNNNTAGVLNSATTFNLQSGTVSAVLNGSTGLLKGTSGTVTLSGANLYSGITNLSAGTLNLGSASALSPNTTLLFGGGNLQFSSSYTNDPVPQFSTGAGQSFNLDTNGQNVNLSHGMISAGGTLNKVGSGILTLAAVNSYSGTTTVTTGTLKMGIANAINSASPLTFASAGTPTFDLAGYPVTVGGLTSANTGSIITNSNASTATLTINQPPGTSLYTGAVNDGTGKVSLAFAGSGVQQFSSTSNYSGGTTINSGTVMTLSSKALGTGPVTLAGGTLSLSSGSNNSVVTVNGFAPSTFTVNTANTPGTANNISGGVLTLTDTNAFGEDTSAFTNTPVAIGTLGFVAKFTYTASGRSGHYSADGATFTLQNDPSGASAIGGGANGLGFSGLQNSAAVELNLYSFNSTPGTAFQTSGAVTSPLTYTSVSPVTLGSEPINATITYNPVTQILSETLVGNTSGSTFTTSYSNVNLASILNGTSAYIGFTGATGGDNAAQAISNFTFSQITALPNSIANNIIGAPGTSSTIQFAIAGGHQFVAVGSMNIGSSSLVSLVSSDTDGLVNRGVLYTAGLTLAGSTNSWTGKLDLGNNSLVVHGGDLGTINNQVKQGYAGGTWQGSGGGGIISTAAASDPTHLTALGVIVNDNMGSPLYGTNGTIASTFGGANPADGDILVKYTYYGDANLDGSVNSADYALIDAGYLSAGSLTGWYNGDFNYDGVINGSDYTLIDNAFNMQGASLTSEIAAPTAQVAGGGVSAVPEPTSIALLGMTAVGLLGRRRKR